MLILIDNLTAIDRMNLELIQNRNWSERQTANESIDWTKVPMPWDQRRYDLIEWLERYCKNDWNWKISQRNNQLMIDFYLKDPKLAILFKLSW